MRRIGYLDIGPQSAEIGLICSSVNQLFHIRLLPSQRWALLTTGEIRGQVTLELTYDCAAIDFLGS